MPSFSYEFVRDADKNGSLECLLPSLTLCAENLPIEMMLELYLRIRRTSILRESEFRPAFEKAMGHRMTSLPIPLRRIEVIEIVGPEDAAFLLSKGYLDHVPE